MQERLPAPEFDSPTGSVFPPPAGRRVYCNRNLRLDQVKAVGGVVAQRVLVGSDGVHVVARNPSAPHEREPNRATGNG